MKLHDQVERVEHIDYFCELDEEGHWDKVEYVIPGRLDPVGWVHSSELLMCQCPLISYFQLRISSSGRLFALFFITLVALQGSVEEV